MMNHQCNYCHKELNRLMFCNHSHQVMYHRKRGGSSEAERLVVNQEVEVSKSSHPAMCKHGRMLGLCEKGCK